VDSEDPGDQEYQDHQEDAYPEGSLALAQAAAAAQGKVQAAVLRARGESQEGAEENQYDQPDPDPGEAPEELRSDHPVISDQDLLGAGEEDQEFSHDQRDQKPQEVSGESPWAAWDQFVYDLRRGVQWGDLSGYHHTL